MRRPLRGPALTAPAAALAALLLPGRALPAADIVALHRLFEQRHEWEAREFPEEALRRGDQRYADRIADQSLEAEDRRDGETREQLRHLEEIGTEGLPERERINCEIFSLRLHNAIDDHRFGLELAPLGPRSGPQQSIPQMAEGIRFTIAADYEHYLTRLGQVPRLVDQMIERMRRGLREGRTPPRIVLRGVPDQFRALLEGEGLEALAEPLKRMPAVLTDSQRETFKIKFRHEVLPRVREGLERLRRFVVDAYIPHCREEIAATALPDGDAYYAYQLRKMTTTDLTARAIYELGLKEVDRIRAEMMAAIRRSDFLQRWPEANDLDEEALFAAFVNDLRTNSRFYEQRPEDLLAGYRDICKRVDAWLPKLFGTLPRLTYGVKKIPDFMAPQQTTAYYVPGSLENGEPGWFAVNTYALDQRPKYEMIALAMHESVPGHHLQSALARELRNVPEFRRDTWFNAFGEGWALYAERLGIEMGLYEDPYDDFGRLLYEMWRACRLVVDPGMHAMGWSRERAIDYLRTHTALSELNIATEVDRYIAWPGQACAYKIGELKIRELRRRAEEKLGTRFDIRAFHDLVLGAGSVPLTVLERRVREWLRADPGGASYD